MKIALIAPSHIPARRANTIQVMKMAQAIQELGHQVRLAAPGMPGAHPPEWDQLACQYGLRTSFPVVWLPASRRLRRYDFSFRAVRWAKQWQADLIYTRLPQAAAISSLAGAPTIFEVHDLPQGRLGPYVFRRFLQGRGARRLVVITRALQQDLARHFGRLPGPPFTMIAPDGVDLERFEGLPDPTTARRLLQEGHFAPFFAQPRRFTAGYTGHLYPGRGAALLLGLAQRLPQVGFLLAGGEPSDVTRLQAEAKLKRLDNVLITGFIPNAELPLYQAACDVLLMPYQEQVAASSGGDISRYLSPMKLFEYLACGRAILSSRLPVLQEVLSEHNAILLPPGDLEAWATALESLHQDEQRRKQLGQNARQEAARFTWKARAAAILDLPTLGNAA